MRTTVTLDRDQEQILRDAAVRTNERFVVHPKAMELRAGLDPAGFNRLVDDLEAEAYGLT